MIGTYALVLLLIIVLWWKGTPSIFIICVHLRNHYDENKAPSEADGLLRDKLLRRKRGPRFTEKFQKRKGCETVEAFLRREWTCRDRDMNEDIFHAR